MTKHLRQQDAKTDNDKRRKDGKFLRSLVDFCLMTDLGECTSLACLLQQVGRPTKGVRINAQPTTFLPHYDTSPIRLQYSPYCVVKEPILQDERGSIATQ